MAVITLHHIQKLFLNYEIRKDMNVIHPFAIIISKNWRQYADQAGYSGIANKHDKQKLDDTSQYRSAFGLHPVYRRSAKRTGCAGTGDESRVPFARWNESW